MGRGIKRVAEGERKPKDVNRRASRGGKKSAKADLWNAQRSIGNRAVKALLDDEHHALTNPPSIVRATLARAKGQPLDTSVRQSMESVFQEDLQDVRVHTDAMAAESALATKARAYASGDDIVFGSGQYAPRTGEGRELLAHELTHVVQQRESGAAPNTILRAPLDAAGARPGLLSPGIPAPVVTRFPGAIVATIYFGHNRFLLDSANYEAVQKLGEELRFMLDPPITIEGHASQEGKPAENLRLSAMRREQVMRLLSGQAIGKPLFGGSAHGESDPAVEETGDKEALERNRALNRRVTVVISLPPPSPAAQGQQTQKKIELFPFRPKPETDEEAANRRARQALQTPIPPQPKTSFNKEFWKIVDEAVDRASQKVGIPQKFHSYIRDGAHAAIEKGAEALLDAALDKAGATETQKEAVKAAINQAADTEF